MAPYLDALIGKLLALLQRGRRNVQEAALTAIAAVADTAEVGGVGWGGGSGGWGRRNVQEVALTAIAGLNTLPSVFPWLLQEYIFLTIMNTIPHLSSCRSTLSSTTTPACPS